ncbi:hypothetical protein [Leifsonia sp. Leaf264]|uniref:hypothetical protein n=1 Tax=Leifsonia sp. Leaf264 TaxID=1736314 RepID=UPI0006F1F7B1|nr:hypothetical protein [Leifsonia sp. Leaf264]KQO98359.1 hypothetical protein ASF30_09880 [Leifsonia sp. Leaf264]
MSKQDFNDLVNLGVSIKMQAEKHGIDHDGVPLEGVVVRLGNRIGELTAARPKVGGTFGDGAGWALNRVWNLDGHRKVGHPEEESVDVTASDISQFAHEAGAGLRDVFGADAGFPKKPDQPDTDEASELRAKLNQIFAECMAADSSTMTHEFVRHLQRIADIARP